MFADAYEQASKFTAPVAISSVTVGGDVTTGLAAFVVVNADGWFLTAAHIFEAWVKGENDRSAVKAREDKLAAIDADLTLSAQKKKMIMKREREDRGWFKAFSYWWAQDGRGIRDVSIDGDLDLAVARLEPFDRSSVDTYPRFHSGIEEVRPGTSVCRLGYPFHEIAATYDQANDTFEFPADTFPIPRFPNDGIITRTSEGPTTTASNIEQRFFETSTPGLRGQSGGPVFDKNGVVYGIQSRTHHLELGFSPTVKQQGREVTEHQFLNVGLSVHPRAIREFLALHNVDATIA